MSLDPRSRERLEALGRQLPRKLPPPAAPDTATPAAEAATAAAGRRRHRVETEQDPRQLFRELMQVSPDGTVPPHLLERLRQLETPRRSPAPQESAATITGPTSTSVSAPGPAGSRSPSRRRGGRKEAAPRRDQGAWALYDEFLQRLEEEDGERG